MGNTWNNKTKDTHYFKLLFSSRGTPHTPQQTDQHPLYRALSDFDNYSIDWAAINAETQLITSPTNELHFSFN